MLKKRLFFSFIVLSLFISCNDESRLIMNSVEEYFFFTIDNGSLISRGTDLQVSFSETTSDSDMVIITLRDSDQNEIAVVEVLPDNLKGEGLPLALPEDLEEGLYLLSLRVMGEGLILSETDVYFYVVGGDYSVEGLETYPPDIRAGESISARAYLKFPEGKDPWIRWTLDDMVLKEGFVSEVHESCSFLVPPEEGVFSLRAELFPVKPFPEHSSSAFSHSDLFVTVDSHDPWTLLEDIVHTFYVSFSGGIADTMNPRETPEVIGDPSPDAGSSGGYVFSSQDGIRYHYNALPLDENGTVQDFTLSMDFIYEDLPSSGKWRMVTIGTRYSSFVLFYSGSDQAFYAGFSSSEESLSSLSAELIPRDKPVSLDLVYTSADGKRRIIWFVQSEILHESDISDYIISENGNTLIGADESEQGLPLFWQSLGIFEPEEAAVLPEDGQENGISHTTPPAAAEPFVLYLRDDGAPDLPLKLEAPLHEGLASLEFLLDSRVERNAWGLSLLNEDGESYFLLDLVGQGYTAGSGSEDESLYEDTLVISFVNNPEGLFLSHGNAVDGPFSYQKYLKFQIVTYNSEKSGLNAIKEIRLYQD